MLAAPTAAVVECVAIDVHASTEQTADAITAALTATEPQPDRKALPGGKRTPKWWPSWPQLELETPIPRAVNWGLDLRKLKAQLRYPVGFA